MTHRINPTVATKVVDLDINHIYSLNHIVEMDKISSSVFSISPKTWILGMKPWILPLFFELNKNLNII